MYRTWVCFCLYSTFVQVTRSFHPLRIRRRLIFELFRYPESTCWTAYWCLYSPQFKLPNVQLHPLEEHLGQTWFSCSLYSFHSEQAERKSSVLEHLCWHTPEYSVFRGGVDRTVMWPVPKQDGGALPACVEIFASLDLFRSTPKCPVLLVYVAVLAYAEYSKNC